ncbi:Kinesin-like protein 6 [Leucoagaricus sp. SymC.cos]|nr:Kinesin-like protein 6 [Leucoagaricus sp. SymC.cos]
MVAAGSITVAVRVRPPTAWEAARLPEPCYDTSIRGDGTLSTPAKVANTAPLRDIVQIVDDRILCFDPDEKDKARAFMERGFLPPGTKRYKDKRFMFDRVFPHEARQTEVYETTTQPLLQGLLDGYNATVFAYGATGCGKTHTISGTESDPGIIYLTMADLFQRIEDRKEDWNVEVMVTFLEIYNEEIRDLLAEPGSHQPRGGLAIREDKTVKVVGLVELRPRNAEEVKEIVLQGNSRRTQSPTHANETSSRSHAVLQVHVTQSPRTASVTEQRTMATLSIIDLAGSERAAATTNMGQRMVEGANINKSLLALGNCINALCESGGAVRHVPYRNSKLTRLLKFSLGGNCKTVMIVCVAPTSAHFDDTHNTLVYAERATKIKTKVVTRNVVNVDRHVGRYVEAINRLNLEVAELKAKLAGKRQAEVEIARRKAAEAKAEVERSRNDIKVKVEQTRNSIVDGATCSGKLSVAKTKLAAICKRLSHLASTNAFSGDVEAERGLLQAMADIEEDAIKPNSALNIRLQRSSNSSAMFDATMKAASERRSEKLDESGVEMVRLEAMFRRTEMEKFKAEGERDALQESIGDMAEVIVKLVGMLGRCSVMIGDAANALKKDDDGSSNSAAVKNIGELLQNIKRTNDATFKNLLGHSTQSYALADTNALNAAVDHFQVFNSSFTRRVGSGPAALEVATSDKRSSRRLSAYGTAPSSPRRTGRTPRKSLRSSLSAQPYRRVSDKERRGLKVSKNVQWRDEAGGELVEDGVKHQPQPSVVVSVIPASPGLTNTSTASQTTSGDDSTSLPPRPPSAMGSESDWEDDNEKTDDSLSMSFLPPSSIRDTRSSLAAPSSSSTRLLNAKRPRPSRLDPSFLKSRSKISGLSSLAEDDESGNAPERRNNPLSSMDMNTPEELETLHVPKGRHRNDPASPTRRAPSSPSKNHLSSTLPGGKRTAGSTDTRRRSNIGALKLEKPRRRSSMLPDHPSVNGSGHGESISAGPTKASGPQCVEGVEGCIFTWFGSLLCLIIRAILNVHDVNKHFSSS